MSIPALARRLFPYARRHRGGMALVGATMLTRAGLVALMPWPLKVVVDNALGPHPLAPWLQSAFAALPGPATRSALLWWAAGATVVLFSLSWASNVALSWASVRFGQAVSYDVAADVFAQLQRLSARFHSRHGIGSSMRRISADSNCVATVVQDAILPSVAAAASLAIMVAIMWALDPVLTVVALAVIPLMVLAARRYTAPMLERSYDQQVAEGEMYDTIEQTLTGLQVVKMFGREPSHDQRLRQDTGRVLDATIAVTWAQFRFKLLVGLAVAIGTAGMFWLGANSGLSGGITVGTLLVFLTYLGSLYAPLQEISYTSSTVTEAAGSARRVVEVLDAPVEVLDAPGAVGLERVAGHVVFEGVWFGYEPGRPVLRGIDFVARPGEVVAVVGATGAGKSTLVSLLPRFFDPDAGRVLLDGHDLREVRLASVRRSVSLVLQESFLFPFSIAENIAFGRPGAGRREIEAAARAANAHEFISALPDGYATVVGERGATLSGGERQRVAIARALLKDAPVLILDEPTSALDAHTESLLLDALDRLMAGRTTLIIAHRLSTIRDADQILVLEHGRIAEAGNHQHLLGQNGYYARMHRIQSRGRAEVDQRGDGPADPLITAEKSA